MRQILILTSVISLFIAPAPGWAGTGDQDRGPGNRLWSDLATGPLVLVPGSRQKARISIGLLLVAIEAQRDHVRISEALRIANPGATVQVPIRITLPPQAQYATFHRGLISPVQTEDGFADIIVLRQGVTEVAYSYALPTGSREAIARVFPFDVERMEIVARGRGVHLAVMGGRELPPVVLGREALPRWELRRVRERQRVIIGLTGLPVTTLWWPSVAAAGLAVVLGLGLLKGVNSTSQNS